MPSWPRHAATAEIRSSKSRTPPSQSAKWSLQCPWPTCRSVAGPDADLFGRRGGRRVNHPLAHRARHTSSPDVTLVEALSTSRPRQQHRQPAQHVPGRPAGRQPLRSEPVPTPDGAAGAGVRLPGRGAHADVGGHGRRRHAGRTVPDPVPEGRYAPEELTRSRGEAAGSGGGRESNPPEQGRCSHRF
jgi:hypothetical protein